MLREICLDSDFLVPSSREIVAEPTRSIYPRDFGCDGLCSTNGCDVWARSGELRCELRGVLAVVGFTWCADTSIACRFEDSDSSKSKKANHVADAYSVAVWDSLLVVTIGVGDDLWKSGVWLGEEILVVREIRLIFVVGRKWFVKVGNYTELAL